MIEGYSDRMIRAPRFVREGNRLIPDTCLVTVRIGRERSEPADRNEEAEE